MKHYLYGMAACAALVALSSCSSEEIVNPVGNPDGNVIFTAELPTALQSTRYGEGLVVKKLSYAVYETGSNEAVFASDVADSPAPVAIDSKNFTLALNLVKGKSYDLIFWADVADNSPYTFSSADKSVSIDYTGLTATDENRDAFFQAVKGLKIAGPTAERVLLRRPFAQINIGTDDLDVAKRAGVEVETSEMTVTTGLYDTLNLFSGQASGEVSNITFAGGVPEDQKFMVTTYNDNDKNKPVYTYYDYLQMNYVLTGDVVPDDTNVQAADQELVDIEYTLKYKNGGDYTFNFANVPVQRNYRTNIYGSLLTDPLNLTIVTMPGFYGDNNYGTGEGSANVTPTTEAELVQAIKSGADVTIGSDMAFTLDAPLVLRDGQTLTIDGKITTDGATAAVTVPAGADVTIKGTGTITYGYTGDGLNDGGTFAVNAINVMGNATIEDVKLVSENFLAGSLIMCYEGSEVVLNNVTANTNYRALTTMDGVKITINGGEFNSLSDNSHKASNGSGRWSYAVVVGGNNTEAVFNDVTVSGVQGGVSVEKSCKATINGGTYFTQYSPDFPNNIGKVFYALYSAQNGEVIVNGGRFYSPRTPAVVASNNDVAGDPVGSIILKGGEYSSIAWNNISGEDYPLPEGYAWEAINADNDDPCKFRVVNK